MRAVLRISILMLGCKGLSFQCQHVVFCFFLLDSYEIQTCLSSFLSSSCGKIPQEKGVGFLTAL